jgi:hypothetical protein
MHETVVCCCPFKVPKLFYILKDLPFVIILLLCPEFYPQDMAIYLLFSSFTSTQTARLAAYKVSVFLYSLFPQNKLSLLTYNVIRRVLSNLNSLWFI